MTSKMIHVKEQDMSIFVLAWTIQHEIHMDPTISKAHTTWTVTPIHSHMQSNQVDCNYLQSMMAHCGFKSCVQFHWLQENIRRTPTEYQERVLTMNSNWIATQITAPEAYITFSWTLSQQEPKHFTDWGQRWAINSTGIKVHVKCTCWSPALMQHCITI